MCDVLCKCLFLISAVLQPLHCTYSTSQWCPTFYMPVAVRSVSTFLSHKPYNGCLADVSSDTRIQGLCLVFQIRESWLMVLESDTLSHGVCNHLLQCDDQRCRFYIFCLSSVASLTFLCLSLVELMSSCRNWDWIWYSRFFSSALSASCKNVSQTRKAIQLVMSSAKTRVRDLCPFSFVILFHI